MSGHLFTFDEFEAGLTYVLQHLYDPALDAPDAVCDVLGLPSQERPDALQTAIIQAVEDLRPAEHVPKSARSWRMYSILYFRFVSNLPQEEVAERVYITTRHLRREQASAIHLLARRLWENAYLTAPAESEMDLERAESLTEESEEASAQSQEPSSQEKQLRDDLLALQESAPGVISNVSQVLKSVVALAGHLPAGKNARIVEVSLPEELSVALHPSALRQVLWMILHQAIDQADSCEVRIQGGVSGKMAFIELAFTQHFLFEPLQAQTIKEILDMQNGQMETYLKGDSQVFRIELINVNYKVLVVEDNPDIVHLYQRYLVGTAYNLIHLASGQELFNRISEVRPDVIVLDIMLPDMDGWDLLTRLLKSPDTSDIPVIVSSVVSDPDLALALGASACLSKPVQRLEFIRALDQVSGRA